MSQTISVEDALKKLVSSLIASGNLGPDALKRLIEGQKVIWKFDGKTFSITLVDGKALVKEEVDISSVKSPSEFAEKLQKGLNKNGSDGKPNDPTVGGLKVK